MPPGGYFGLGILQMLLRVRLAPSLVLWSILAIVVLCSTAASADDRLAWQFFESTDPDAGGRKSANLSYGVPETDDIRSQATCSEDGGDIEVILGADTGKLKKDAGVDVRFSGGGSEFTIDGTVHHPQGEFGIAGVRLELDTGASLWSELTEKSSLDYQVPGYAATSLELEGGHRQIGNFIDACRAYMEKPEPQKTAQAESSADAGQDSPDVPEKEAFDAAKELGTIEAWEAFLTNYPDGFRADLARAYVKRIATGERDAPAPARQSAAAPPRERSGPADISIALTANQGICSGGAPCGYAVTATNTGGSAFSGPLAIASAVPPGNAELSYGGPPPWSCEEMGGGAVCAHPGLDLAPGQSIRLTLTYTLDDDAEETINSCASVSWGGVPGDHDVRDVQRTLNDNGFDAGPVDGQPGQRTSDAIEAYQEQRGLSPTGEIDVPLLVSLFTDPAPGDANPANDRACAGSAVRGAPVATYAPPAPRPAAERCYGGQVRGRGGDCVCPRDAPVWTGKSCMPRVTRNCTGGRYYSKSRKTCVCPSSRPYWYNNRCFASRDDCPGDSVRVGNRCVKENDPGRGHADRHPANRRPADRRPGGNQNQQVTVPNAAAQILNQFNKCSGGRVRQGSKCRCPGNQTFDGKVCVRNQPNNAGQGGQKKPGNPPPPIVKQTRPQGGQKPKGCPPGQIRSGANCVARGPDAPKAPPPPKKIIKKCPGGLVPHPNGGCTPGACGPGQIATPAGCVSLSDARLKRDVALLATLDNGIRLYSFRYLWDDVARVGVMAQELLERAPTRDAVSVTQSGYYAVDYRALGLQMTTLEEWRGRGLASVRRTPASDGLMRAEMSGRQSVR